MKLRRGQRPPVDEEALALVAAVYVAFVDGVALCRRLTEQRFSGAPAAEIRRDALSHARYIAYASRVTVTAITADRLLDRLSPELHPTRVLAALARIGYGLVALAEDAPEPEALLTQSELQDLGTQFGIDAWLARIRQLSGKATEEQEQ
jgi:hypothetical protein